MLKCVCLDGPRNQTIILIDKSLTIGSRLECFADGNPAPNYEWNIVGKNIPLNNGSVIVISESMVSDEEQKLRCRSWNVVDGQTRSNETTFTLTPAQHSTRKKYVQMCIYNSHLTGSIRRSSKCKSEIFLLNCVSPSIVNYLVEYGRSEVELLISVE